MPEKTGFRFDKTGIPYAHLYDLEKEVRYISIVPLTVHSVSEFIQYLKSSPEKAKELLGDEDISSKKEEDVFNLLGISSFGPFIVGITKTVFEAFADWLSEGIERVSFDVQTYSDYRSWVKLRDYLNMAVAEEDWQGIKISSYEFEKPARRWFSEKDYESAGMKEQFEKLLRFFPSREKDGVRYIAFPLKFPMGEVVRLDRSISNSVVGEKTAWSKVFGWVGTAHGYRISDILEKLKEKQAGVLLLKEEKQIGLIPENWWTSPEKDKRGFIGVRLVMKVAREEKIIDWV